MKTFLVSLLLLCLSLSMMAEDTSSQQDEKSKSGVFVDQRHSSSTHIKRIPTNVDFLLIIEDDIITILCTHDFGLGSYQLMDLSTNTTVTGNYNSSLENYVTISYSVSDFSSLDFYIEFEDGSWCQLTWN